VSFCSKSLRIPTTRDFELICNLFGHCDREEVVAHNFARVLLHERACKKITKPFKFQSWQKPAEPPNSIQLHNYPEADNVLY